MKATLSCLVARTIRIRVAEYSFMNTRYNTIRQSEVELVPKAQDIEELERQPTNVRSPGRGETHRGANR
jgi:hypothetical protein